MAAVRSTASPSPRPLPTRTPCCAVGEFTGSPLLKPNVRRTLRSAARAAPPRLRGSREHPPFRTPLRTRRAPSDPHALTSHGRESAQGLVHGCRVREGVGNVGVQEDHVGTLTKALVVVCTAEECWSGQSYATETIGCPSGTVEASPPAARDCSVPACSNRHAPDLPASRSCRAPHGSTSDVTNVQCSLPPRRPQDDSPATNRVLCYRLPAATECADPASTEHPAMDRSRQRFRSSQAPLGSGDQTTPPILRLQGSS